MDFVIDWLPTVLATLAAGIALAALRLAWLQKHARPCARRRS
nr:hypothetical protein [Breoghania sp.]